ncbi:MAG TPA: GNAT family N-acetyltransferase [Opitutaceae bacterium]|nr:GNAT family N-acetyltransferase [Opitutaceae bacterium]
MDKTENLELTFRSLRAYEIDEAHAVYLEACAWLRRQEIRLWLQPLPREKFMDRQQRGELFGLFAGRELAVTLAITNEAPAHWQDELGDEPNWWLGTIATAAKFKGRGLGERAVAEATRWLGRRGTAEVLLDCATGFLPRFYQRCGFWALIEKDVTLAGGNTHPLVLMKMDIAPVAAEEVKNNVA